MRVTMLVRCLAMMRGGGETRHLAWARELTPDDNLSVDGVKEMVLRARDVLSDRLPKVAARVTRSLVGTAS